MFRDLAASNQWISSFYDQYYIWILCRNRTVYTHIYGNLLWDLFWGLDHVITKDTICHQQTETHKSCWCNLVQVQRFKNQESRWGKYQSKDRWKTDISAQAGSQEKENWTASFLYILFYAGPRWTGWCPSRLGRATCFSESTDFNANLIQKHP